MTWRTPKLKNLAKTFTKFKNQTDLENFLRDLCTIDELEELSNRWEAVQMLNKNLPYREISKKTGLSTTTITRIAYWLEHGEGGYQKALKK